jgi:hypothetical protein
MTTDSVSTSQPARTVQKSAPYTAEEQALIDRMKNADIPTIKAYVRSVLNEEVPAGFELPEVMKQAGDSDQAERVFAQRYPEFYGKQGPDYLRAVAASPVRYRQLILETRAVRQFYQKSNN